MTGFATFGSATEPDPGRAESLADIVEWLFLVFEARLGLVTVLAVVHECCDELDVDSDSTPLGRLEFVARERLTALALTRGSASTDAEPARTASPRPRMTSSSAHEIVQEYRLMSSNQPPTADDARLDAHNSEVNQSAAEQRLCGMTHLATGHVCLLPERHAGGCNFVRPDQPLR